MVIKNRAKQLVLNITPLFSFIVKKLLFKGIRIFLLPFALACYPLPVEGSPVQGIFIELQSYQLDNGLRVVLAPQKDKNTVTVRLSVQVGALDEQAGESGYAHLFEHMMFKGTPDIGDGEYFNIIKKLGGHTNAVTDFDATTFFTSFPPTALEQVLWLEADRLQHLEITPEKLKNQISAVLEEKALNLDNQPYASALAEFVRKVGRGSGYEKLVIGLEQDLEAATLESIKRFYDQYYHPANIVLVVSGGFSSEQAKYWISEYFAKWIKPGKVNIRGNNKPELDLASSEQILYDPQAPYPVCFFAWLQPGTVSHEYGTNTLIGEMLLSGQNSLFRKQLRLDENSFLSISMPFDSDNMSLQWIVIAPRSYASKQDIDLSLDRILSTPADALFTEQMLLDAKLAAHLSYTQEIGEPNVLSYYLAEGIRLYQDPLALIKQQQRIQAVTLADIQNGWQQNWQQPDIRLEVTGGWQVRWGKTIMQWLPKGAATWLEDRIL